MSLWNRLCYWIGNKDIITRVEIRVEFLSSSGNCLFSTTQEQIVYNSKLYNSDNNYWGVITDLENKNREFMNKVAKDELVKHRKKKFIELHSGYAISGKHIVRSRWSLNPKFKRVNYKKYMEIKNGPK